MKRVQKKKASASIFSPDSVVGAFTLYFVVPTILLLLGLQYIELPSELISNFNIETKTSSGKASNSINKSTHTQLETQSIQNRQRQVDSNNENKKGTDAAIPLPKASPSTTEIDTHIKAARQVLRVSMVMKSHFRLIILCEYPFLHHSILSS